MSWPWSQLGLPGPVDLSQLRHAYAEKLKTTHPEDDPEGFQRLHAAYQTASRMARQQARQQRTQPAPPERPPETPPGDEESEFDGPEDEGPSRPGQEDFDFEELLQGGGEPPRRAQEGEQDFDFDELLQGEGERSYRSREDEEERDFDFDELLQEEKEPPRPRREEPDFDFERLFAEGEAERAEERRRRGEERRRAQAQAQARERERQKAQEWARKREHWQRREEQNTYNRERRDQFRQEQDRWQSTETILHTIEMMYNARAEKETWQKFFQSPLFQQNKESIDLIFGLEDFVSDHPDLPHGARVALFLAYGFDKGVSRPELRPLYQMLLSAWRAEEGEQRQKKLYKIGTYIGGLILAPVALFLLASGWFFAVLVLVVVCLFVLPKFVFTKAGLDGKRKLNLPLIWLLALGVFTYVCVDRGWGLKIPLSILAVGVACGVVRSLLRSVRQDEKSGGRPGNKKDDRLIVALTAAFLAVGISMLFMPELEKGLDRMFSSSDPREQVCRYLEQDYGVKFRSLYDPNSANSASARFDNVFAPKDNSGRLFLAGPDGERDKKAGKLGYTSNYPEMMVLWRLQGFAKDHGLRGLDTMDRNQNLESWNTTGVYLIVLPRIGAGETITALGDCLEEIAREDWYQVRTPEFKVVLCSEQFQEGRLILQEYQSDQGTFDAKTARSLYEESFGHACCGQLLEDLRLDRDFVRGGEENYTLTNQGMAQCKGEDCFLLYGLDSGGGVAMEYYVSVSGGSIYCVPGGFWKAGGTEEDIQFYRMTGQNSNGGFITLYYPWITVS